MKPKYLIFAIFFLFSTWWMGNVFQSPPSPPCDLFHLKTDVPLQIQEAIRADGGQNTILTRFFHNKPLFYGRNFAQCYLKYFNPNFLFSLLSFIGLAFFFLGFFSLIKKQRSIWTKTLFLSLTLIPLLNILGLFEKRVGLAFFALTLWIISFYGLWILFESSVKYLRGRK